MVSSLLGSSSSSRGLDKPCEAAAGRAGESRNGPWERMGTVCLHQPFHL